MSVPSDLVLSGPHALRGRLRVPGDKGMSHRALLFAAMAEGSSRITGLAGGDDVFRTRRALTQLRSIALSKLRPTLPVMRKPFA